MGIGTRKEPGLDYSYEALEGFPFLDDVERLISRPTNDSYG